MKIPVVDYRIKTMDPNSIWIVILIIAFIAPAVLNHYEFITSQTNKVIYFIITLIFVFISMRGFLVIEVTDEEIIAKGVILTTIYLIKDIEKFTYYQSVFQMMDRKQTVTCSFTGKSQKLKFCCETALARLLKDNLYSKKQKLKKQAEEKSMSD